MVLRRLFDVAMRVRGLVNVILSYGFVFTVLRKQVESFIKCALAIVKNSNGLLITQVLLNPNTYFDVNERGGCALFRNNTEVLFYQANDLVCITATRTNLQVRVVFFLQK